MTEAAPTTGIVLTGRVTRRQDGIFADDGARLVEVDLPPAAPLPPSNAWLKAEGSWAGARFVAEAISVTAEPRTTADERPELPEARFLRDPSSRAAVVDRARLIRCLRDNLDRMGFLEVHTPFLHAEPEACHVAQLMTTGANGRRLYLRTDPEEYLKRYLTAGFAAVYEVSNNARGETPDRLHLQEFTSVECYRRFWTFTEALDMAEQLCRDGLVAIAGKPTATLGGRTYDFSTPLPRRSVDELIADYAGLSPREYPGPALADEIRKRDWWQGSGSALDSFRRTWIEWLLDTMVLPALTEPVLLVSFPTELGLSARETEAGSGIALRGELCLPGGFELAHVYENIVEPDALTRRYRERREHRLAAGMPPVELDIGLQASAELGMPPMCGIAIGVDRLLMLGRGDDAIGRGLLYPREGFVGQNHGQEHH